jgi:hypothetical protein
MVTTDGSAIRNSDYYYAMTHIPDWFTLMPHTYCGTTKYIVIVERLCHERIEDISLFSRICGRKFGVALMVII